MISKGKIKLIRSLRNKKRRREKGFFLIEGEKISKETLASDWPLEFVLSSPDFYNKNRKLIDNKKIGFEIISPEEIRRLSALENSGSVLIVAKEKPLGNFLINEEELVLALDEIKEPGNFGSILRIADWYGIRTIIASVDSVDSCNNKTIAASMGSFLRVKVFYKNLAEFLPKLNLPIFGAFLSGESAHDFSFPKSGVLLMGNESRGIRPELEKIISQKISIPKFGGAESLNVAMATAVLLDNWRRRN